MRYKGTAFFLNKRNTIKKQWFLKDNVYPPEGSVILYTKDYDVIEQFFSENNYPKQRAIFTYVRDAYLKDADLMDLIKNTASEHNLKIIEENTSNGNDWINEVYKIFN